MADENKLSTVEETDSKAAKTEKDAKPAKEKKPGFGKKVGKYFRDSKGEFKKIIWPTLPSVVRNTGVTLAMCAVLGVLICVFDLGLSKLIELLVSL